MSDQRRTTDRELIERFSKEPRVGDEPERMIGGPHEVTEQYRSEPERLKAVILDAMMNGEGTLWEDIAADAARAVIAVSRQAPPADQDRASRESGQSFPTDSQGSSRPAGAAPSAGPYASTYWKDHRQAPPADLREQVIFALALREGLNPESFTAYTRSSRWGKTADAVLAVFAEAIREATLAAEASGYRIGAAERGRLLRERIETLGCENYGNPCSLMADVLAEFDDHPPSQ